MNTAYHCDVVHWVAWLRAAIERLRLENEALKAELNLEHRETMMLESEPAKARLAGLEKEAANMMRRVEELRRQEFVRVPRG